MSRLELKDISKRIGGNKTLFELGPISLEVKKGECLALIGGSGCGKTSLLKLIAGFESPDAGSIDLAGRKLFAEGKSLPVAQRKVGYVFQEYALFPHLDIRQNLLYGAPPKSEETLKEVCDWLKIKDQLTKYPHELSGGQQQRVAIGRTLLANSEVLLLDEPLSNIDEGHKIEVREELQQLIKRKQLPAILVSHDLDDALAIADQIAIMVSGKIVQIGTADELFSSPNSIEVAKAMGNWKLVEKQGSEEAWGQIKLGLGEEQGEIVHRFATRNGYRYRIQLSCGQDLLVDSNDLIDGPMISFTVGKRISF